MANKKQKPKRAYSWSCITYETTDYLITHLSNNDRVAHYCFIEHNLDIKEDGSPKDRHIHLLVTFTENVSLNVIKTRILHTSQNVLGEPITDKRAVYRYLTHKDNPDKYLYDEKDIVANDDYFSKDDLLTTSKETDEIETMIMDYLYGESYLTMAKKYGRDFIKNFRQYQYYFTLVGNEQGIERKESNRLYEDNSTKD